ncbi:MAG TPA: acyltransferase [Bacteroidales bacterium]|jgi:acetyltransferase-like isoleucine patch superfamily enzyme|nr:acyltransferase [Bacteroidales bacterium]
MMILKSIIQNLRYFLLVFLSSESKIRYLRKQGMKIGKNCHFQTINFSTEPYLIEIGDHVAITSGTKFITHDGGMWCFLHEIPNGDFFGKIKIGNNVHIGASCIILPNTIIGNNSMVGAGSVVRGKFPDNSVIIGNPARKITDLNVIKFYYQQSPGLIKTYHLTDAEKKPIVKKHFNIT